MDQNIALAVIIGLGGLLLGGLYLLPTFIGITRQVESLGLVVAVNFIGGPTVVGWPAALILAVALPSSRPEPSTPMYFPLPYQPLPHEAWLVHMLNAGYDLPQIEALAAAGYVNRWWPPIETLTPSVARQT